MALGLLAVMLALPMLGMAQESAGVGLSKRLICYTFATLNGTVGLLLGFCLALYGLWTIIQGSPGWGIGLILGGAILTQVPNLVAAFLGGTQNVLESTQITEKGTTRDPFSELTAIAAYKDDCNAIVVNMDSSEPRTSSQVLSSDSSTSDFRTVQPLGSGADGSSNAGTGTGVQANSVASTNDADELVEHQNGTCVGRNCECAALVQELAPDVGHTSTWKPGDSVADGLDSIEPGTAIATFQCNDGESYCNASGTSHTGIFLGAGPTPGTFYMLDQYNSSGGPQVTLVSNNGLYPASAYHVITH